jgi:NADH-quinone oxidoreductase subunit B
MECLLLLQEKVGAQRRPLSWLFGPQQVEHLIMPSMRDLKQEERTAQRDYPAIDRLPRTDPLWRKPGEQRPGEQSPNHWRTVKEWITTSAQGKRHEHR